ncbi:MAG TPA: serine hydrolase domain-containing protein, partial [Candidatus Binataceae bacterium]|nr:serine hydrolase domain-containing protein [Candidatus Binataceae bacterium]
MKSAVTRARLLGIAICFFATWQVIFASAFAQSASLNGDWSGSFNTDKGARDLTLHVTQDLTGAIAVSLEGILRSDWNCPGSGTLVGNHFSFRLYGGRGSFDGTLSGDGRKLSGTWTQEVPVSLEFRRDPGIGAPASTLEPTPSPAAPIPPVALADLKPILDREMSPVIESGLLARSTGGGVVIGVLDHGSRRIFSYGSAKPDSIFEIASITKTFTGLLLAQMIVRKELELDEPVRALLPANSVARSGGAEITLLDLATHRSGLPSDPDNLLSIPQNPYAGYDSLRLLEFVGARGLAKPKGAEYFYCNFGFGLLGYALSRRAGVRYEDLVKT